MLLYGGVLLARAEGEAAGDTFFAGEAGEVQTAAFQARASAIAQIPKYNCDNIVCDDLLLRGTGTFSLRIYGLRSHGFICFRLVRCSRHPVTEILAFFKMGLSPLRTYLAYLVYE